MPRRVALDTPAVTVYEELERTRSGVAPVLHRASERFHGDVLRRRMLVGADTLALLIAAATVAVRDGRVDHAVVLVCFAPVWILLAKLMGLYDRDHRAFRCLTVDELPTLLFWSLLSTAAMTTALLFMHVLQLSDPDRIAIWLVFTTSVFVLRAAARASWRKLTPPDRVLIVGDGMLATATRRKLELFPDIHARPVAIVPAVDGLELHLDTHDVDRIVLACDHLDEDSVRDLIPVCRRRGIKLTVIPPARGMFGTAVTLGHVADLPLLEYNTWDVSRSTLMLKRVSDVAGAAAALVVLSPIFAIVSLAIFLDSGRPIFFRQERAGANGAPFHMRKFRTMVRDAESRLAELVQLDELAEPSFKLRRDPRVTRVGRLLRRTSLDELPQLINVLRGEMSLVGPRPEQLDVVELYRTEDRVRLTIKPGLTGPMQVFGRGELSFDERIAVEREYIENLSMLRDIRILFLTISAVATGRGAY